MLVAAVGLAPLVLQVLAAPAALAAQPSPQPFSDPGAVGALGLYDTEGQPLTHGSINTQPFAAAAVGTEQAPSAYAVDGRTATLAMYDPVSGQPASQWSGDTATASTHYGDAAHPAAYATSLDYSLATWLGEYTPQWDGYVQLRLLLGAPNESTLTSNYSAATIQVTGSTWKLIGVPPATGHGNSPLPASIDGAVLGTAAKSANAKETVQVFTKPSMGTATLRSLPAPSSAVGPTPTFSVPPSAAVPAVATPNPSLSSIPSTQATLSPGNADLGDRNNSAGGEGFHVTGLELGIAAAMAAAAIAGIATRRRGRSS